MSGFILFWLDIFFLSGFSFTVTDDSTHRTAGKGRGSFFISLYHFHRFTNIQTFICNFAFEMTITYFQLHRLYLPDCYSMKFTTLSNYHLIDWWCEVSFCLITWWFDSRILGFGYSNLDTGNPWTRTRIDYHLCITSEPTKWLANRLRW